MRNVQLDGASGGVNVPVGKGAVWTISLRAVQADAMV